MIDFIDNNSDLDTVNFIAQRVSDEVMEKSFRDGLTPRDIVAKKFMELWKE